MDKVYIKAIAEEVRDKRILEKVSLDDVWRVAYGSEIEIDSKALDIIEKRRKDVIDEIIKNPKPAYGFNRGFGHNVDIPVPQQRYSELQNNLIRSHSCGVGDVTPIEVVRAAMFLRVISLSQGYSGVRPEVIKKLIEMLNKKITPVVPKFGSVGASGDLAPMSHIALAMIGEGDVFVGSDKDRKKANNVFTPISLEMKEGLALNNGVQYSTAFGILAYFKMIDILKSATVITAISTQVMLGADTCFNPEFHELRPHRGALKVSKWVWELMKDSPIRKAHSDFDIDGEVQDPYNIRCAAQILGTCYDLIEETRRALEVETNSVTDNPLIFPNTEDNKFINIISVGHFHGMPVAVKLYNLIQAIGIQHYKYEWATIYCMRSC
ncbi:MAG: aromatic amino acid ammonia-lyase [bacterium]